MMATAKNSLQPLAVVLLLSFMLTAASLTVDIGDKKYYIVTGQKANWFQANFACTAVGMSLDAINTDAEHKSLKDYFYKNEIEGSFWLAGSNLAEGGTSKEYTWISNGKKVSSTKWASDHPDSTAAYCIFANDKFALQTQSCESNLKNFICSRALVPNCGITGRCKRTNFFN